MKFSGDIVVICFGVLLLIFLVVVVLDAKKVEKRLNNRDEDYDKELNDYKRRKNEKRTSK